MLVPPTMIGGWGICTGLGSMTALGKLQNSPENSGTSSVHNSFFACTHSPVRCPRRSHGIELLRQPTHAYPKVKVPAEERIQTGDLFYCDHRVALRYKTDARVQSDTFGQGSGKREPGERIRKIIRNRWQWDPPVFRMG